VSGATSATLSLTSLTNASDNNDQYRVVVSAVDASPVTSSAATLTVTQAPNAPTGLTAAAGNAQLALAWTAPSAPGSSAITGYTVEYTPSGGSAQTVSTGGTGTSYTLTGLTNGTAYTVRVAAVNSAGTGSYSGTATATPPGASVPGVPTSVTITGHPLDCEGFDLRWSAPASDGGSPITGYRIISAARFWGACGSGTSRPTNCGLDVTVSAGTTRYLAGSATGMPGGEPLYIGLFAINAAGSSAEVVVSNYTRNTGGCN
jgi:hypothetical protein